jgi:hypothetical protein
MNLKEMYDQTPDWLKTGLWIGFSQAVASILAYLVNVPELTQYAGLINFLAYAFKEYAKSRK